MQRNAECSLCQRPRRAFFCARCTSDLLQQRRTMLAALQADVAVLRKKTEFALNTAARVRGTKIREVFALFGLRVDSDSATSSSNTKYFRSIASLPLPISGRFEIVPPEVVAAALGKVIRLLTIVAKRSSEGKQVQTAFLLENSQTLDASAQILPEYSMVQ
ncbi:hypothetical protein ATCC90586_004291 [Pythium insidiosum]|nr:hypothetical protein ATCC90586_004291 [Pythium insidiosum]